VTTEMGLQPPTFIDWLLTQPYFFALFFCTVWALACFVIGLISGWNVLSNRFSFSKGTLHGETWPFRSARMRFLAHYGNCLSIGADGRGCTCQFSRSFVSDILRFLFRGWRLLFCRVRRALSSSNARCT